MSEIKKVTLHELAKLDVWKMRVTPEISERVQKYLIDNIKTRWSSSDIQVVENIGDNKTFLYFDFGLFKFDFDSDYDFFRTVSDQEVELKIKKVTIEELYKLDSWKMKNVSHATYKKINKVFNNRLLIDDYFENGSRNLDLYYDKTYDGITLSKRDNDCFFNDNNNEEVKLIEENEVKKVNLEYLLDNDKWQLKVTPEQSEMVQLALFDVGVDWNNSNPSKVIHTDYKWLSRKVKSIYYGNGFDYESLELEEQPPQNDFDTQQEIFRWLSGDNKIQRTFGGCEIVSFIDGVTKVHQKDGTFRRVSYSFDSPKTWKKVTNWYDKLDGTEKNARLCWVDSSHNESKTVRLILKFVKGYYINDGGSGYKYATPLTNDEIKAFMVGE